MDRKPNAGLVMKYAGLLVMLGGLFLCALASQMSMDANSRDMIRQSQQKQTQERKRKQEMELSQLSWPLQPPIARNLDPPDLETDMLGSQFWNWAAKRGPLLLGVTTFAGGLLFWLGIRREKRQALIGAWDTDDDAINDQQ